MTVPITRTDELIERRHADGLQTYHQVLETIVVDGRTYVRGDSYGYTWQGSAPSSEDATHTHHFHAQDNFDQHPEVLCGRCQAPIFTINFGSYSVIAKCAACGFASEIYSG